MDKLVNIKTKFQKGFSILEILLAMAIALLTITAVLLVSFGSQSLAADSQTSGEAQSKAQALLEMEQANSRLDFGLVNPWPSPPSTFVQDGIYKKSVSVTNVDVYTKQVTVNITWTGDHNRTLSSQLSTLLTNPEGPTGGGVCSSVLSGDWTNPVMAQYEFGKDIVGDPSSGFPITDVAADTNKLYVTVSNSNGNNFPTFFILDISDPTIKPPLLQSVDNDPSVKTGLNAVTVSGNYAYVANASGANFATCSSGVCGQLQVIDISVSPAVVVSTFKIPGVTGQSGQAIGKSVFYKDGIVYLGLAKTLTGPEFNLIDVGGGGHGGSPTAPVYLGGYSVANAVNSITVKNNYAYIATPNVENLTAINVSNPVSPVRVGGYSPAGGSNGESVFAVGNTVYMGRTFGSNEFNILDSTNPTSLSVLGLKDIGTGNTTSINRILVRDYLAFLITNAQFQIWRIDNPASVTQYAVPLSLPGGSGTALNCSGNYIFVGSLPTNDKGFISIISSGP